MISSLLGNVLLTVSMLSTLTALCLLLLKRLRIGGIALLASGASVMLTSAIFSAAFMVNDFSIKAVYDGSSRDLSPMLKLAASWSGASGSLLFLSSAVSMASLSVLWGSRRWPAEGRRVGVLLMGFFLMGTLIPTVASGPFQGIAVTLPNGRGLDPSLQTALSVIHPPIVFGAYAAILYVFVVAFARRRSDDEGSYTVAGPASFAWVLLTMGVAVGGFWAYSTLGWGGYWSWDPIETSAIVPWLFLSALVFFRPAESSRDSDLFVLTLTASSALFTMYVARGANAPSVHSYGTIVEGTYMATLVLIPILLFAYVAFVKGRAGAVWESLFRRDPFPASFWSVMGMGLANMVALLLVLSGGLPALHISRVQFFDYVNFPFLLVFVAAELNSTLRRAIGGNKPWLTLAIVATAATIGLLGIERLAGMTTALVAFLLFSLVLGMKWRGPPTTESGLSLAGKSVFILGVSALLVGVVISSTMMTAQSAVMSPGQSMSVSGIEVGLSSLSLKASPSFVYLPFYGTLPESLDTVLRVRLGGSSQGEIYVLLRYYPALDRFYSEPSIEGLGMDDVYVTAGPTDDVVNATSAMITGTATAYPSTVKVTVDVIPGVRLVWAGVLLVLLGGGLKLLAARSRISPYVPDLRQEVHPTKQEVLDQL